jgi:hypothetical protein
LKFRRVAACAVLLAPVAAATGEPVVAATAAADAPDAGATAVAAAEAKSTPLAGTEQPAPAIPAALPAGTVIYVALDEGLSTATAQIGDHYAVSVAHDVVAQDTVVIPRGTTGWGEVTFVSRRGGFGKPGILGIALREVTLGNRAIALDGHYREEGINRSDTTAAVFFAAGIFGGLVKGDTADIPQGRQLRARTGTEVAFVVGAPPPAVPAPEAPQAEQAVAGSDAAGPAVAAETAPPNEQAGTL